MPARFIKLDRYTPMLLPCDRQDWIPEGHLVHFILAAVVQLPLVHFHVNHRGTGSQQYPPPRAEPDHASRPREPFRAGV